MDITPLQAVIAVAAFIILAMSLFYKWMRDLANDLKSEMQLTRTEIRQTRTELNQKIDDVRTELNQKIDDTRTELIQKIDAARAEAREDNLAARAEAREDNLAARAEAREDNLAARAAAREDNDKLGTEIRDLRNSVDIRLQGVELDRAKAAAYDLLQNQMLTIPAESDTDDDD